MDNKRTKSIARSLLVSIIIVIIAVCSLLGIAGYQMYSGGMSERYQVYLRDLLTMTLTEFDGDDLATCIETGQKSQKFEETNAYLDMLKESYDIEYIYVLLPLNTNDTDNMMDVMCGATAHERAVDNEYYSVNLGELTGDSYPASVAANYLAGMDSSEVTFFGNQTEFGYDYTGMIAIRDSKGDAVAVLAADVSMNVIQDTLSRYRGFVIIFTLMIAAAAVVGLYRWMHRRVVSPLSRLENVSQQFVESSHVAESPDQLVVTDPDIHTGDEMESLSDSISDMFGSMKTYMSDLVSVTKEKERIGAELDIATQIQKDMLPSIFPAFPQRTEFDLYASMDPAKEVGGDFYDYFLIDDDHLGLVIADVSSKGVPAALFMVIAKTLLKNRLQSGESPAVAVSNVNDQLAENNEAGFFVTIWCAVIEISTGKALVANAGHEHPVIRRGNGTWELVVYKHDLMVGVFEGLRFKEHYFQMRPGDQLFVYTDGVPEAQNAEQVLFGNDRMLEALNSQPEADPEQTLKNVRAHVDAFVGEAEQFDDLTMLSLLYKGPQG